MTELASRRTESTNIGRNVVRLDGKREVAFQISADFKKRLLKIAKHEARSLSQICELLLRIGVDEYDKDGHKYLQRVLALKSDKDQS